MPGGAGRRTIPIYLASLLPSLFSASLRLCAKYNSFLFKPLRSLAQASQTAAIRERERPSTGRTDRVWRLSGYQRRCPPRTEGWPKADNPLHTPLGACRNHKGTPRPAGPGFLNRWDVARIPRAANRCSQPLVLGVVFAKSFVHRVPCDDCLSHPLGDVRLNPGGHDNRLRRRRR